jgi:hypothetical protein
MVICRSLVQLLLGRAYLPVEISTLLATLQPLERYSLLALIFSLRSILLLHPVGRILFRQSALTRVSLSSLSEMLPDRGSRSDTVPALTVEALPAFLWDFQTLHFGGLYLAQVGLA